jgi:hypothetical protein
MRKVLKARKPSLFKPLLFDGYKIGDWTLMVSYSGDSFRDGKKWGTFSGSSTIAEGKGNFPPKLDAAIAHALKQLK